MIKLFLYSCVLVFVCENEASRILAFYPTPSFSHQVVFRHLTLELVKRGHEMVVITTDPIFPKGDGPPNLKEIDLHDLSYKTWQESMSKVGNKVNRSVFDQLSRFVTDLLEKQLNTDEVQMIIKDKSKTFDLIIVEAFIEGALVLTHLIKAPVIQFSSMAATALTFSLYGAPMQPFLYPGPFSERVYNLTVWDKMTELYYAYTFKQVIVNSREYYQAMLRRVFGLDVPLLSELKSKVDMLFLNVHSVWDSNRPVPPNIIYLGGLHQQPPKDLPKVNILLHPEKDTVSLYLLLPELKLN